jgi:hypothetical protein
MVLLEAAQNTRVVQDLLSLIKPEGTLNNLMFLNLITQYINTFGVIMQSCIKEYNYFFVLLLNKFENVKLKLPENVTNMYVSLNCQFRQEVAVAQNMKNIY